MQYITLDTNAWIYLANGTEPVRMLEFIRQGVDDKSITLLLPELVISEWHANKEVAIKNGVLKHFNEVSEGLNRIVKLLASTRVPQKASDFFYKLSPSEERGKLFNSIASKFKKAKSEVEAAVAMNISLVEELFAHSSTKIIPIRSEIYIKAGKYAVDKKAPFLKKNSFADALILFSFINYIEKRHIYDAVFVTYNTDDFCEKRNSKNYLHPDLVPDFKRSRSNFYNFMGEALKNIDGNINLEFIELIREAQIDAEMVEEEEDFSEEFCWHCFHHINFKKVELDDKRVLVVPRQFEFDFAKSMPSSRIHNALTRILAGECSYCETEYFTCASCGTVNLLEDEDYEKTIECEGSGCYLPYYVTREYGSDFASDLNLTTKFTILPESMTCQTCGKEFWSNGINYTNCSDCEDELFYARIASNSSPNE